MALARCKKLKVLETPEGFEPYRSIVSIFDQQLNKTVSTYRTRAKIDTIRVSRTWRGLYRIPDELVTHETMTEEEAKDE